MAETYDNLRDDLCREFGYPPSVESDDLDQYRVFSLTLRYNKYGGNRELALRRLQHFVLNEVPWLTQSRRQSLLEEITGELETKWDQWAPQTAFIITVDTCDMSIHFDMEQTVYQFFWVCND